LTVNARAALVGSSVLTAVLLWSASAAAQSVTPGPGKATSARHDVILTLRIADGQSGLTLEAKKPVPKGSNALQVLQDTVLVKYKTYPNLGAFVTSLCGIHPPKGFVWTFAVDNEWSTVGIGSLTLERDTVIEWKTR
jgi:hypothetical protein